MLAIKNPALVAVLLLLTAISGCVQGDELWEGNFDTQVHTLLDAVYMKPEEILNITRVLDDIKNTLEQKWTGVQILPIGSLVTGLVSKTSDVDVLIRVQDYNLSSEIYLIEHTEKLMKQQPDIYTGFMTNYEDIGVAILSFFHIPTQRSCDVTFKSKTSVENSQLLAYYFKLDPRNYALAAILKYWSRVRGRTQTPLLRNYVMNLLIVFYLQQKNTAPPINLLRGTVRVRDDDDLGATFTNMPYYSSNTESLYQLLGGFYKYYSELNFSDYMISTFFGRAIPRKVFQNTDNIPEEFTEYRSYIKQIDRVSISLDGPLCIQDLFVLNENVASSIKPETLANFIREIKFAARAYEDIQSNRFLRVILTKDEPVTLIQNR